MCDLGRDSGLRIYKVDPSKGFLEITQSRIGYPIRASHFLDPSGCLGMVTFMEFLMDFRPSSLLVLKEILIGAYLELRSYLPVSIKK